jgi:hypothetical protein
MLSLKRSSRPQVPSTRQEKLAKEKADAEKLAQEKALAEKQFQERAQAQALAIQKEKQEKEE